MISKTTSVLGLSIDKSGYNSNSGSANSKSGIGLGSFSIKCGIGLQNASECNLVY